MDGERAGQGGPTTRFPCVQPRSDLRFGKNPEVLLRHCSSARRRHSPHSEANGLCPGLARVPSFGRVRRHEYDLDVCRDPFLFRDRVPVHALVRLRESAVGFFPRRLSPFCWAACASPSLCQRNWVVSALVRANLGRDRARWFCEVWNLLYLYYFPSQIDVAFYMLGDQWGVVWNSNRAAATRRCFHDENQSSCCFGDGADEGLYC